MTRGSTYALVGMKPLARLPEMNLVSVSYQAVAALFCELSPAVFCAPGRPRIGRPGPLVICTFSLRDLPSLLIFPPLPAALAHFALRAVVAIQRSRHRATVAGPVLSIVTVHFPSDEVLVQGSGTVILLSPASPKNSSRESYGICSAMEEHESKAGLCLRSQEILFLYGSILTAKWPWVAEKSLVACLWSSLSQHTKAI